MCGPRSTPQAAQPRTVLCYDIICSNMARYSIRSYFVV